ncbi:MAG: tyrosine-protein phosphatase [Bacteroidota bacterium]
MLTQVFRILGGVTLLLIVGCTEPAVDDPTANDTAEPSTARLDTVRLDTAYVDRSADGVLRVHWASTPADAPVALYVSDEPAVPANAETLVQKAEASPVQLPAQSDSTARIYVRVVPEGGQGRVVAERHLPLAGAVNFRDLGGYASADGRRVRWGQVYRTGKLDDLTDQDLDLFSELGVRMVADLRRPHEIEADPDRYPETGAPRTVSYDISGTASGEASTPDQAAEILRKLSAGEITLDERMADGYRDKVLKSAPLYAQMFEELLDPENRPFLFHCQGGKDRAGIGAALILLALDVPRETIMEDYLLTNTYRVELSEEEIAHYAEQYDMSVDLMRGFVDQGAVPAAMTAAFDAIETAYGSTDAYLREALGLSTDDLEALRAALLE